MNTSTEIYLFNKIITLSKDVLNAIYMYSIKKENNNEIGGVLIGQTNDKIVHITKMTPPSRYDISKPFQFIRSNRIVNSILIKIFKRSGGREIYLGEWHTHPEKKPRPSLQDGKMIKEQYQMNILQEPFLLLLIVGYDSFYIGMLKNKILKGKNIAYSRFNNPYMPK